MKKITFLAIFVFCLFSNIHAQNLKAIVDERIELLSIVFRLAGNQEYNQNDLPKYTNNIRNYFDSYKKDTLIKCAVELRQNNHIGYDAVMSMAIHLQKRGSSFELIKEKKSTLDKRWKDNAPEFLDLLNKFYERTNFSKFFLEQKNTYNEAINRFNSELLDFDTKWYTSFYGKKPNEVYKIIIGYGNGGGNYGPKISPVNAMDTVYAIMGAWKFAKDSIAQFTKNDFFPTLIHEFNHSYVNPLLEIGNRRSKIKTSATLLLDSTTEEMSIQAYSDYNTLVNESLVRAAVVRYEIDHHFSDSIINKEIIAQQGRSFYWTPELVELLGKYSHNRSKYRTLDSFYPEIIHFFDSISLRIATIKNNFESKCPSVIDVEPLDSNKHKIAPGILDITIHFSEAMNTQGHSFSKGNKDIPELVKIDGWSNNNKDFTLTMKTNTDKQYEIIVTPLSFKNTQGYPLKIFSIDFTTTK